MEHLACRRCGRPAPDDPTGTDGEGWNGQWTAGRLAGLICPGCQTPLDVAEAEANAAELAVGQADGGHFAADPVICMNGAMSDPGAILYGADHLRRIAQTGRAEPIAVIEHLPVGTECVPTVGGVMIHQPTRPA
ncbi:hypothetical protein ACFVX9_17830 [Kitasatospora sp. NPDC058243]|uniref:hypothetical protein n=1 Tax=Kitasatospora sp. NPDC058243 TaxID=3346397 RepID=UPI0036DD0E00